MTAYPYRTMFIWVATLALLWLALFSPWSLGWNLLCAVLVVLAALAATAIATRRIRTRRAAARHVLSALDAALSGLPPELKRNTPLVLVVGENDGALAESFGADLVRITDAAIWVRTEQAARLMHLADALKRWRDGQGPDAVAYLIAADQVHNQTMLDLALRRWRSAIGAANRALGYTPPVCVAVYAEQARTPQDEGPWFGVSGAQPVHPDTLPTLIAQRLEGYTQLAIAQTREPRAQCAAQLDALARWACVAILPALLDPLRNGAPLHITGFGVTAVQGRPAADSLYAQFVTHITGLNLGAHSHERMAYPLPQPLLRGIARQPARRAVPRAVAHALAWGAVGFCAAAAASAWQNRSLLTRVDRNMARYRLIEPARDAARRDALQAVKSDRDELDRYARHGVPPRLSLGFYRGAPLLPQANDLIAAYRPPAPPPATVELDSMSLFDTGSARLKPGSNRALVGALEMIKAHAHKRVLVAGHTDAVGSAASNQSLSEARARAVRDWLADAAAMPPSRFAIQGYGESRPKAANDTAAGRAANRRVEITLVPDCRDDRDNLPTAGQQACSFE